jgi:hypothetical protein
VAAIILHLQQHDRARLSLMAGISSMVLANIAILAVSRGAAVWVASRYGTICLWGSVASLVAIATTIRRVRLRPHTRWIVPILAAMALIIVGGQAWRYVTFTEAMRAKRQVYLIFLDNVSAYLKDPSPDRTLREFEPFPNDLLKRLLDDRSFVAVLPSNLQVRPRPPRIALRLVQGLVSRAEWLLAIIVALGGGLALGDRYFQWRKGHDDLARRNRSEPEAPTES